MGSYRMSSEQLARALRDADAQLAMCAECIEKGRYDEALLHASSMSRVRREALAAHSAQGVGGAFVRVPRDPTAAMMKEGMDAAIYGPNPPLDWQATNVACV